MKPPARLELRAEEATLCSVALEDPPALVAITDHADRRIKERLGLPKKARLRAAERAYRFGRTHADARGALRHYLDYCWSSHRRCNNVRIYGENLWFFLNETLITVYEIPKRVRGAT